MSRRLPFRRIQSVFGPLSDPHPLPQYHVVLHRSPSAGLLAVAAAVAALTRYGDAEVRHRMWECHHLGRTVVLVTHLERAELYVEQFEQLGFYATIEPVPARAV